MSLQSNQLVAEDEDKQLVSSELETRFPKIKKLTEAISCQICYGIFNAPVMAKCKRSYLTK